MIAMTSNLALLIVWLTFLTVAVAGAAAALVWAVRAGQFSHQDYARYLALRSGIPQEPQRPGRDEPSATQQE